MSIKLSILIVALQTIKDWLFGIRMKWKLKYNEYQDKKKENKRKEIKKAEKELQKAIKSGNLGDIQKKILNLRRIHKL